MASSEEPRAGDDDAAWTTPGERHHEVEVALVASSPSWPEERTLAVTYLERDPTKRERRVRAATGSQAGRRVRLRVPREHSPMTVPSILPDPARDPRRLEEEKAAQQMLRIRVGGLTLLSKISPPLPTACRPDDPPLERQFGTLRADGIAVQLRFAPYVAVVENAQSASTSASGQPTRSPTSRSDDGSPSYPSSSSSSAPTPASYKLLDGAFTADHLATDGRAALAAAGPAVATAARDALLVLPAPAPRAGRSPAVGRPMNHVSEADDPVDEERAPALGIVACLLACIDRVHVHYSTSSAPVVKRECLVPESVS